MNCEKLRSVGKRLFRSRFFYFCLALTVINLSTTRQLMTSRGIGKFALVALVEVMLECAIIGVLLLVRKKKLPLEKQFLVVAILIGLLFILVLPPGQSPDEGGHFLRAYGVSDGYFIAKEMGGGGVGSPIPIEADFLLKQAGWQKGEGGTYGRVLSEITRSPSGEKTELTYNTLAVYNFVCYIPQAVAIFIGRALGFSVLAMAYLAEIFNFIVWVLLIYFAIKIIPRFKTFLLFIALLPIMIQEATSMAPDALTIGLGIFMIAYVVHIAFRKRRLLKNWEKVILVLIAIVISLCKIVYLPMVFLYLILPVDCFGTKKRKWIFVGGVIMLAIVINLVWLFVSFGYILETNPGVDAKGQMIDVLGNPLYYSGVILHTFGEYLLRWINEFLGMSLGAMDFRLSSLYFVMSFAIMVILLVQRGETLKMTLFQRCVIVSVFIAVCLLICTSLYVQWTARGNPIIEGIQGRYFLPIVLLIPLMLCKPKVANKGSVLIMDRAVMCYSVFVGVMACATIWIQNV